MSCRRGHRFISVLKAACFAGEDTGSSLCWLRCSVEFGKNRISYFLDDLFWGKPVMAGKLVHSACISSSIIKIEVASDLTMQKQSKSL